ncbi:MAG: alpha/beta fold hydrolase [Desulfosalsimonas sp.]
MKSIVLCASVFQEITKPGFRTIPLDELEKKYANENSRFLEINGARVHFREEGSGLPLLLLHGAMASLHTWDGWADALREDFRIIRVDLPGNGLTGPVPGFAYTGQGLLDFLETFVDAMALERFYLAGNSLGGFTAWNYAVRHPEKVKKLILIAPAGYPQKVPDAVKLVSLPLVGGIGRVWTPRSVVAANVRHAYGDPDLVSESLVDRYYELLLRPGNRGAMIEIFRAMNAQADGSDPGETIKQLSVPALLMWGEKDRWVPLAHVEKWKNDVADLRVITYPGAGHAPMEEIPGRTARDARKFLCE